ncbi:Galactose-1-phosphate uridylyltransferase [Candidatus Sulfotelmatobacter kueseliae]|uniref:Galactose-1-phosphate uridylyltransferase n=1 Tax=Candidatus Sulfotelmatobacter kueseliae TaxID=2042962 RepID=A0A2U3LAQ8_9BACT|nr:Galactose-1-phosphate uridylyltransferase [Candidatus Sulfotelmatobacter kueseliae]
MPELRQNFMTKEWVVIATDRAKRPDEMVVHRAAKPAVSFSPNCPFCPGHENQTPPEILRLPDGGDGWKVRVVPNKYSALSPECKPDRTIRRSFHSMAGFGVHDIVIETPDHSLAMALMPDAHVADILRIYKTRYDELSLDPRIAHVTIFKNSGTDAGTSLEHPHSQLIATPVISYQVRQRFQEALRHYDEYGCCIFCQMIEEELQNQERIVLASERFVAVELYASPSPFFTHIYPRRHMASFGDISAQEIADLGRVLRTLLGKLYYGLENPDFNLTIRTAPAELVGVRYFHWYLSVIPRLTRTAGFELGSGMFINTVIPEQAAEFLRKVKVETAVGVS